MDVDVDELSAEIRQIDYEYRQVSLSLKKSRHHLQTPSRPTTASSKSLEGDADEAGDASGAVEGDDSSGEALWDPKGNDGRRWHLL